MLNVFAGSALALLAFFVTGCCLSIFFKRKDIADIFWGLGFIVVSWTAYAMGRQATLGLIVSILVSLWGLRLSCHIFLRNKSKKEDYRYQSFVSLKDIIFKVFLLQGFILYIVALPILWIQHSGVEFSLQRHLFLIFVWCFGFVVESLADYQLSRFLHNKERKEKFCKTGLWAISRHPNYAGELLQWWIIFAFAITAHQALILIVSPMLLTFIMVKVSGIAPLEKKYAHDKEYLEYKASIPALFPASWINSFIFYISWFVIVAMLGQGLYFSSFVAGVFFILLQFFLFKQADQKSYVLSYPLLFIGVGLASVFEKVYLDFGLISYIPSTHELPLAILTLYGFFCISLNSSMQFLNKKLWLTALLGGGALFSYIVGQKLGAVELLSRLTIPELFVGWGLYLVLIVLVNRNLHHLYLFFTDKKHLEQPLIVFFDTKCPICKKEMENLQKRKQTGALVYANLDSSEQMRKYTTKLSKEEALKAISAVDEKGEVLQGTLVLSEIYARTNWLVIAILLQAPVLKYFFKLGYFIWARIRPRSV